MSLFIFKELLWNCFVKRYLISFATLTFTLHRGNQNLNVYYNRKTDPLSVTHWLCVTLCVCTLNVYTYVCVVCEWLACAIFSQHRRTCAHIYAYNLTKFVVKHWNNTLLSDNLDNSYSGLNKSKLESRMKERKMINLSISLITIKLSLWLCVRIKIF